MEVLDVNRLKEGEVDLGVSSLACTLDLFFVL